MADQDARALLLTIQANTELLRSNLSAAEKAIGDFASATQSHLDKNDAKFEAFGKGLEKLEGPLERLKSIGEGAFAFLVGESLIEKGKQALEFAGNIQFLATQVGVSTDFLQKFRYAASQSGASIEVSNTALTKFSRSVGEAANGDTALVKLFNNLGVNVLDAGGKVRSVEGVFKDTADAIQKLPDPAQRVADTMTLMGRGAASLVPVLSGGAAGFNQLADAAQQLGIVLGPELIEHSEQVNHKLAALKLILDAQMASAVAQNAAAIERLASAMVKAAGSVATFLNAHPDKALAIAGALAGFKLGGPIGALAGAAGGYKLGGNLDQENRDASLDHTTRSSELVKANSVYQNAKDQQRALDAVGGGKAGGILSGPTSFTDVDTARKEYNKQLALFRSAKAKGFEGKVEEPNLGSTAAGDHNPALKQPKEKADHSAERAANNDRAYQAELQQAQDRYAKAMLALSDTAEGRYRIEVDELDATKKQRDLEIDDQVKAKKISQAQADKLKALNASTTSAQKEEALRKEIASNIEQFYALAALQLQAQVDALQVDDRLATTRKQRLAIELKLLDYQQQQALNAQHKILDDPTSNKDQRDRATAAIGNINAAAPGNRALVQQQNLSPLDAYRQQLKGTVGDTDALNDSLQNVAVSGIKGMEDALVGVVSGTKSLGAAFKEMASSIISDLLRIAAEKAIFSLLGFSTGGGVGSASNDNDISIDHAAAGYAVGGVINGPGNGTSDSVLARLSNGEFVVNASATSKHLPLLRALNDNALPGFADGGMIGPITAPRIGTLSAATQRFALDVHSVVTASPEFDVKMQNVAARTVGAAAQPIMLGATAQTVKKLRRLPLPGTSAG